MALNNPNNSNNIFNSNSNFGQNVETPYVRGMTTHMPQPMAGNLTEDALYPLQASLQTPQLDSPVVSPNVQSFAKGGKVKRAKSRLKKDKYPNLFPSIAEMIRQQGGEEDTVLAHINPIEAKILSSIAHKGGRINPVTGLPQFGFFDNPKKWLKGSVGGGAGAILGNMILPGVGGIIGGALGGMAGSAVRGRKDHAQAGLRGAAMGGILPTASSLLGAGANKLGYEGAGKYLTDYGDKNSILKSLGMKNPFEGNMGGSNSSGVSSGDSIVGIPSNMGTPSGGKLGGSDSYLDQWLKPKNLMAAVTLGGSLLARPKKESAEKIGRDLALKQKAYDKTMELSPQERAMRESDMLAERQMQRRLDRNQYLPEERFSVKPTYRKTNSPEEYERTKKWIEYYDNPQFKGQPLMMKKGGLVPKIFVEEEEIYYPSGLGYYFEGHTKGQDDKIDAKLSDGEYVIPADVVAHAGDGNNAAGAKSFDKLIKTIRKKKGGKSDLPPKIKPLISYMR